MGLVCSIVHNELAFHKIKQGEMSSGFLEKRTSRYLLIVLDKESLSPDFYAVQFLFKKQRHVSKVTYIDRFRNVRNALKDHQDEDTEDMFKPNNADARAVFLKTIRSAQKSSIYFRNTSKRTKIL